MVVHIPQTTWTSALSTLGAHNITKYIKNIQLTDTLNININNSNVNVNMNMNMNMDMDTKKSNYSNEFELVVLSVASVLFYHIFNNNNNKQYWSALCSPTPIHWILRSAIL